MILGVVWINIKISSQVILYDWELKQLIMSQNELILEHLKEGKSITAIEALNLFGCFRLSARIHNLRDIGCNIETDSVTIRGKTFASY